MTSSTSSAPRPFVPTSMNSTTGRPSKRPSGVGVIAVTSSSPLPRVLVIDDDEMVRRALARVMRRKYTVHEERSAESALTLLESGERFDAILCDLNLSGMSGRDFVVELDAVVPDQAKRVIILSGASRSDMDDEFLGAISTRFLEKPATLAQIDAEVAGIVNGEGVAKANEAA